MASDPTTGRVVVVLSTAGSDETARRVAAGLVERRLAACVNVVPGIVSTYRWDEGIQTEEERLLIVKTTGERAARVEAAIRELHDYDLPEVVVLPVVGGSEGYLGWVESSVTP